MKLLARHTAWRSRTHMPDVTFGVVLLNWNGCADTIAALESLLMAQPRPAWVTVVDNGSHDDSVARLAAWGRDNAPTFASVIGVNTVTPGEAPWLLLVDAKANLGFSSGNNLGLSYLARCTTATHMLLLNNDAMVAPDYFARMRIALEQVPDAGLMGCLIYHYPECKRVWYAGAHEIPHRALLLHDDRVPDDDAPRATVFVTGCAMLIARHVYEALGGLAECYNPIYWEDGDYSFQVRRAGWPVLIAPGAHVYHRVGATGGGERPTPRVLYLQNRNRMFFVRRNYRGMQRVVALAYLFATKPARALVEGLIGRPATGSAILRGFVRGLVDTPA